MMNCHEALELLLEADPDAMQGHGDVPVAAHLRQCARCRAVGARLLADTAVLAQYAQRTGARRTRAAWIPRSAIAGAGLAAATLVLVVRSGAERTGGVVALPDTVFSIVAAPSIPEPLDSAPIAARPELSRLRAAALQPRAFEQPVAATPVRFVASQPVAAAVVPESAVVTVTPAHGTRAFVLKTRNPAITVVWLER